MKGKKARAVELLAIGEMTQQAIAEEIGVKPPTISSWKKDEKFMQAVVKRSRELLKESLPEVYNSLTNRSKKGSDRHIKLFLDHLEKLEEIKSNVTQITFTWKTKQEEPEDAEE